MKIRLLIAIITILLSSVVIGQTTVRGKITDENGESMIGASVVLKSNRSVGAVADRRRAMSLVG